jgi:hypothetical protein
MNRILRFLLLLLPFQIAISNPANAIVWAPSLGPDLPGLVAPFRFTVRLRSVTGGGDVFDANCDKAEPDFIGPFVIRSDFFGNSTIELGQPVGVGSFRYVAERFDICSEGISAGSKYYSYIYDNDPDLFESCLDVNGNVVAEIYRTFQYAECSFGPFNCMANWGSEACLGVGTYLGPTTNEKPSSFTFAYCPYDYMSIGFGETTGGASLFHDADFYITDAAGRNLSGCCFWVGLGFSDLTSTYTYDTVAPVPVPAAAWLLAAAFGLLGFLRRTTTAGKRRAGRGADSFHLVGGMAKVP